MDYRQKLKKRLCQDDIIELCYYTQGHENDNDKAALFKCLYDPDTKISFNALKVFSKFTLDDNEWLYFKHYELIDMVLHESHDGKRRLLLYLLLRQQFDQFEFRTDFLDFCLGRMIMPKETIACRILCMKLAYEQCKKHLELSEELRQLLFTMPEQEQLTAGLKMTWKNIMKRL